MTLKIATVAIYVEDQKKALKFWTEQIGLSIVRSHPVGLELKWVELSDDNPGACLVIYPRSMMQDWAERKPSIVFECEDVQKKYEELAGRGVVFTQEPKKLPWGLFAIFMDTEGNWFGLRDRK
jgi:lactoylglutathione lyase